MKLSITKVTAWRTSDYVLHHCREDALKHQASLNAIIKANEMLRQGYTVGDCLLATNYGPEYHPVLDRVHVLTRLAIRHFPVRPEADYRVNKFVSGMLIEVVDRSTDYLKTEVMTIALDELAWYANVKFAGSTTSKVPDGVCSICGIGFRLPSGRCDHCDRQFSIS